MPLSFSGSEESVSLVFQRSAAKHGHILFGTPGICHKAFACLFDYIIIDAKSCIYVYNLLIIL